MAVKLTVERLKEVIQYNRETGMFHRAIPCPGRSKGSLMGNKQANGYVYIKIDGKSYMAHRLAWLDVNGEWPEVFVDHINGDRSDNRLINLRAATRELNAQNQRVAQKHNKLGILGVSPYGEKYYACIRVNGKTKYLGLHETPEVAHQAYLEAKRKYHEGCMI